MSKQAGGREGSTRTSFAARARRPSVSADVAAATWPARRTSPSRSARAAASNCRPREKGGWKCMGEKVECHVSAGGLSE